MRQPCVLPKPVVRFVLAAGVLITATFYHPTRADGPPPTGPVVSDRQRLGDLEAKGNRLLADGKVTALKELIAQLGKPSSDARAAAPREAKLSGPEVYERCARGVLVLGTMYKCAKCPRVHCAPADGFVITESGVAVTNYHIVNQPDKLGVVAMTLAGDVYLVKEVLAASEADDLAVIQLEGEKFEPLPVASDVFVISHPDNRLYTFSRGIVSRYATVNRNNADAPSMQITADYARGSSGAPVLDESGAVVGVVCSTSSVYYNNEAGNRDNLQMVFKDAVPSASLLKLLAGGPPEAPAADARTVGSTGAAKTDGGATATATDASPDASSAATAVPERNR